MQTSNNGCPQSGFGAYFFRYWHKAYYKSFFISRNTKIIQLLNFLDANLFLKLYMFLFWCFQLKFNISVLHHKLNTICEQYCRHVLVRNNVLYAIFYIKFFSNFYFYVMQILSSLFLLYFDFSFRLLKKFFRKKMHALCLKA